MESKHQTLQGLAFPLQPEVQRALQQLKQRTVNYIQLVGAQACHVSTTRSQAPWASPTPGLQMGTEPSPHLLSGSSNPRCSWTGGVAQLVERSPAIHGELILGAAAPGTGRGGTHLESQPSGGRERQERQSSRSSLAA